MLGIQATEDDPPTAVGGRQAGEFISTGRVDHDVTGAVEDVLRAYLGERLAEAARTDAVAADELAGRLRDMALRGGKRLRARFLWWGWRACGGDARGSEAEQVLSVAAALELIQTCAVVHDDVMDRSSVRRGAAAVHEDFARQHARAGMRGSPASHGTAGAILVGDLALAWADDLLASTALSSPRGAPLHREWRAMRWEMVAGQYLDVRAAATGATTLDEAVRIAHLKSALYTVERPLALGAALAGAADRTLGVLRSAGRCAGMAFQLRDDLLGVFGDPGRTGKPADDDLRDGKLTYLRAIALRLADESGDVPAGEALRVADPPLTDEQVRRARAAVEGTGARRVVEAEISRLVRLSERHLAALPGEAAAVAALGSLFRTAAGLHPSGEEGSR
ncbi:geranylgeranyl pyrophosphate synthase [Streptomyces agglomeratus]|uniref:Geranylgeranyl pyrophosphate synthase n=1 Tax=Streptomyces agglomeratus TaxID=285458 RepID=A0A1E5PGC2_9ACTN|nr:polyprenyl synthetase family protein [Streptomyces agglomeratus]OEJ28600.1 geranylgeranyl pyrophosphate synthase [Streptomyces agglomeratus]OEJ37335.1 geranylgeranyl pyrophosphate synthase [Streptomyces agglomeratus]OEJ48283.1 geranylgeranyl pyrophosphate synthase [Streptomyces agglomeratus]OEJ49878.1 geranylgeranyl pyrophosphate synthase [Streptomyces agglomeratus]OEJ57207.1 geranylgeranyl pyrophosphate synthase [Streptomyces agglomeratus]